VSLKRQRTRSIPYSLRHCNFFIHLFIMVRTCRQLNL
jgi:hypothetical protein